MKARMILDGASLNPSELKMAREAFDGAWQTLAPRYDAASMETATNIVLSLVPDTKDAAEIQAIAVQEMTKSI